MKIPFRTYLRRFFKPETLTSDDGQLGDAPGDAGLGKVKMSEDWLQSNSGSQLEQAVDDGHQTRYGSDAVWPSPNSDTISRYCPYSSSPCCPTQASAASCPRKHTSLDTDSALLPASSQTSRPPLFVWPEEGQCFGRQQMYGRHIGTPLPSTPPLFTTTPPSAAACSFRSSAVMRCKKGWSTPVLATPLVQSSLHSLHSCPTPADAFPDLLQIIEQENAGASKSTKAGVSGGEDINTQHELPRTDFEFLDMLITVAEELESEKNLFGTHLTHKRPEDDCQPDRRGQRKCKHAKRMTEEEEEYMRRNRRIKRKEVLEKRKRKLASRQDVRRSSRQRVNIQYFP